MADPTVEAARKPWRWRFNAGVLTVLVGGVVTALSVGRGPTSTPKLPNPNGYDDIVKAGSLVKGPWPNKGDLARATVPEIRAFVEANKATLDLARVGLDRVCVVPLENSQAGLDKHFNDISPIRAVGRLLQGEAKVAEADGRIVDASKAYLAQLALGQAVTQGGMAGDLSVGCAVQWLAIIGLRNLSDRLPAEQIPAILRELEVLDRKRVPLEAVEARWLAWYQGTHNPILRAMFRWSGVEQQTRTAETNAVRAVTRPGRPRPAVPPGRAGHPRLPRGQRDLAPLGQGSRPGLSHRPSRSTPAPASRSTTRPTPTASLTDDLASIARPDGEVAPPPAPKP